MFNTDSHRPLLSLHDSARVGNLALLKQHIDNGSDINLKTADGLTALMLAAQNNHLSTVNYLLSRDADVSVADPLSGHTAFFMAVLAGHTQIVKHMIEVGADVCSIPGTSALMLAVELESFELTKFLLEAGVNVNARRSADQSTALMLAAMHGKQELVELLLAHGAQVNAKNHQGCTALVWAVEYHYPEVVQALLTAGADPEATDELGQSVLISAISRGQKSIIELLLANGANVSQTSHWPLIHTIAGGNQKDIIELLLAKGIDIDASAADGTTPLMLAVKERKDEVVATLLDNGADVNLADHKGNTALIFAVLAPCSCCPHPSFHTVNRTKVLLSSGAHLYHKNNEGKTALDYLAPYEHKSIIDEYKRHIPKFAWQRRRHAICFYARRHHVTDPALRVSLSVTAMIKE